MAELQQLVRLSIPVVDERLGAIYPGDHSHEMSCVQEHDDSG